MTGTDLKPPWVLFCDRDKPVAILPAGRPGEVAKVGHLSMQSAKKIVSLANQLHAEIVLAGLEAMHEHLDESIRAFTEAVENPAIDVDAPAPYKCEVEGCAADTVGVAHFCASHGGPRPEPEPQLSVGDRVRIQKTGYGGGGFVRAIDHGIDEYYVGPPTHAPMQCWRFRRNELVLMEKGSKE